MAVKEDVEALEVTGVWPFMLARGYITRKQESVCLLQAASWLSTGQVDYGIAGICPVIQRFGTSINDILTDADRQVLKVFPARIAGTFDPSAEAMRKEAILRHVMQVVDIIGRNQAIDSHSSWLMSYMDALNGQPEPHSKETLDLLVSVTKLISPGHNPVNYFVHKVIDSARKAVQEFHNVTTPHESIGWMVDAFEHALILSSLYSRMDDRLHDVVLGHIYDCFTDMLAYGKASTISPEVIAQRLVEFEAYACQQLI